MGAAARGRRMPPKLFTEAQLRDKDHDTIKRFLRYRLGGYRIALKDITVGNRLYRGVECPELAPNVGRISYKPAALVTNSGRANRAGVSVFYASVAAPACFYEIGAVPGQRIALSEWVVSKPMWFHNLGFHPDALRRLGVGNLESRSQFAAPIPTETKANARLRLQLSLAFTERVGAGNEHRYKQSIAIFENLFDGAEPLEELPGGLGRTGAAGAVYPAMSLNGMADNLAIAPEFVDRGLTMGSVRQVLVEDANPAISGFQLLTIAMAKLGAGGTLEWETLTGPEIDRRTFVALEGGRWTMRNGHGEITLRR